MNGIMIIDKPAEFTSFDVVAVLRGLCKERRIGHTGTLDPMATGVLPVLLGRATRAMELLPDQDKVYIASFALGRTSDTEDIWGDVRPVSEAPVERAALEKALEAFRGEIKQIPPMYSAIKQDGQRLYTLARQGVIVERAPRKATVHELTLQSYDEGARTGTLKLHVSKGTYVRSIISGLGEALSVGGVMTALRRMAASGFALERAVTLDEVRRHAQADTLFDIVLPVEEAFLRLSAVRISENQATRFTNGGGLALARVTLPGEPPTDGARFRVRASSGRFLGLGQVSLEKQELSVLRLFDGGDHA